MEQRDHFHSIERKEGGTEKVTSGIIPESSVVSGGCTGQDVPIPYKDLLQVPFSSVPMGVAAPGKRAEHWVSWNYLRLGCSGARQMAGSAPSRLCDIEQFPLPLRALVSSSEKWDDCEE